jgi:hypothetical protein
MAKTRNLKDLRSNIANPRSISKERLEMLASSLGEFGDISGIVWNRKSGRLIGGHQRRKLIPDGTPITFTKEYSPATKTGTVAEGFIEYQGERFAYREVDWDGLKEYAGMVAANRHGGRWNGRILAEVLLELDSNNYPMDKAGFSQTDLEAILAPVRPMEPPQAPAVTIPGAPAPESIECPHCGQRFTPGAHDKPKRKS